MSIDTFQSATLVADTDLVLTVASTSFGGCAFVCMFAPFWVLLFLDIVYVAGGVSVLAFGFLLLYTERWGAA